ncbi:MAG: hypothetical protein IJM83_00500, partial [Firmicutes bacterium]|nr:hypothetical protein [Bacillota bacterium]
MKKLLVMLLAAALCVSLLAGCTKTEEQPSGGTSEATTQQESKTETSTAPSGEASGLRDFTC